MATRSVVSILIQARDQASAALARVAGAIRKDVGGAVGVVRTGVGKLGGVLRAVVGAAGGFGAGIAAALTGEAVFGGIERLTELASELDASLRRLSGAAKLVGAPLDFMHAVAEKARREFALDHETANALAAELVTLAARTGNLNLALEALGDFLNLGAAQGLNAAQTLDLIGDAANGNERTLRRLFNLRPEEVFNRYAVAVGKLPEQLTDADRVLAIFTTAQQKATLVGDQYQQYLDSVSGKQEKFKNRVHDAATTLGEAFQPVVKVVLGLVAVLLNVIERVVEAVESLYVGVVGTIIAVGKGIIALSEAARRAASGDFSGALDALKQGGKDVLDTFTKTGKKIKDLFTHDKLHEGEAFDTEEVTKANKKLTDEIIRQQKERERLAKLEAARRKAEREAEQAEAAAARERADRLKNEVALIQVRVGSDRDTTTDALRLFELEEQLKEKLADTNLVLSERVDLEQQLATVQATRAVIAKRSQDAERDRAKALKDLSEDASARARATADAQQDALKSALEVQDTANQEINEATGKGLQNQLEGIRRFGEEYRAALVTLGRSQAQAIKESQALVDTLSKQAVDAELGVVDVAQQAEGVLRSSFSSFFAAGIEGFDSLGQAAYDFLKSVAQGLAELAAQMASNALFNSLFHAGEVALSASFAGPAAGAPSGADYAALGNFATGGWLRGKGGPKDDANLFWGSNGEFVVSAAAAQALGSTTLNYINQTGQLPTVAVRAPAYASGGLLGAATGAEGGMRGLLRVEIDHSPDAVLRVMESPAGQQVQVRTRQKHPRAFSERRRGPSS